MTSTPATGADGTRRGLGLLLLSVAFVAGCAAGGAGQDTSRKDHARVATKRAAAGAPASSPAAADWEAFARTDAALDAEILRLDAARRSGAGGTVATELASRRLVRSGRGSIREGDLDVALERLERALSLDGADGYAPLFLAYVHHVRGDAALASAFLGDASRLAPRDAGVRAEVEGLARSIAAAGGGRR